MQDAKTSDEVKFEAQDLRDWLAYEEVRKAGKYNMFDERAQRKTGLSTERFLFVLKNFSELKAAVRAEHTEQVAWLTAKDERRAANKAAKLQREAA